MQSSTTVDVDRVLEAAKLRGPALVVLFCAASSLILDGFDIQAVGFVAPALVGDLHVERAALGPALAASLVGMAIGAAGIGALGDRWGRRRTLVLSTALFGLATLLAASATSVATLALWRFVTGIGLGGALTAATALIAEFSPRKFRAQAIGAIQIGVPIGGMLGAMLAAELMPAYGWRSVFVVGGVLPLLVAALMYFVLPESPRFLATRSHARETLARLMARIDPAGRYSTTDVFVLGEEPRPTRSGVRALFSPQLRWDTAIVSLAFMTNMYAVYAFFSWAPLVLTSLGFELVTAVRGALVFNLAGIGGVIAIAWLIARFGSRRPLAAAALLGAAALASLALFAKGLPALMSGIAVAGIAINAVQVGLYALAAHVFPTECRTSGVGFSLGAGRTGGIAAALGGGMLLSLSGAAGFFGWIAGALVIACVAVLLVRRQIAGPASYFAGASTSGA
ncbi:MAG TPA: MFS transporter [Steroidobacteraceae bacterium]|jgi:AAHS family 4-hydroxybenzoate transporter-like MFS transporter